MKPYLPQLYGRSQVRPLKPAQARLMASLLPAVAIPDPAAGPIDLDALFPGCARLEIEIGFGGGEHLAWQAARAPDAGFIGAEPFVNGVAKLLQKIEDGGLANVRVHHGDARPLLEAAPSSRFARIYALYPDPWPKRRHFKRRLASPWFFAEAARLLIRGGELRIASDVPDYVRWTLMHARRAAEFEWTAERADDWRVRPDDWPPTRYEAKALRDGRTPAYLRFRRR
jgi:tRNA (guanine-N7-)-methyltransferase